MIIFTKSLALFGFVTLIVISGFAIAFIVEALRNHIAIRGMKYKMKHRFDKPPTAKCYCIDCYFHDDNGRCRRFEKWHTADNWFCWMASPYIKEKEND